MPTKTDLDAATMVEPDKPRMFMVTFHNDDYTPMDFVVIALMKVFKKPMAEATEIMMTVHKTGKCDVSAYTYDIAVTKKMQAQQMAEENGYPLKITVREVL